MAYIDVCSDVRPKDAFIKNAKPTGLRVELRARSLVMAIAKYICQKQRKKSLQKVIKKKNKLVLSKMVLIKSGRMMKLYRSSVEGRKLHQGLY